MSVIELYSCDVEQIGLTEEKKSPRPGKSRTRVKASQVAGFFEVSIMRADSSFYRSTSGRIELVEKATDSKEKWVYYFKPWNVGRSGMLFALQ